MQKKNRILFRAVAMLLCVVMATTCLVSTIFARYVTRDKASVDGVKLKNWGITIETGTHAKSIYEDSDGNTVVSTKASIGGAGKLIAPGTRGSLAWFHVFGSPEVDYNIDLNGSITIGNGYTNSVLTANEEPITYFPIVLYLVAYEVTYDGEEMILTRTTDTNDYGKVMNFAQSHLREEDTKRNTLAGTNDAKTVACWRDVADIAKTFNGNKSAFDYMSLNKAFDQNDMSGPIDRVYALEWCWPYKDGDSYPRSDEENFKQGTYQTREYDTQLGEKMRDNAKNNAFDITVNMNIKVEQAAYVPPYTRNGDVITFGSYPQTQVTDNSLITTLNGEVASADTQWTSQLVDVNAYNSNNNKYVYYVDVSNGGDKYRGVSLTSNKTNITWFKFEPVKWLVLTENNGTALIISQQILDMRLYQEKLPKTGSFIPDTADAEGENGIYVSSWEHSTIREWLNNTFYETVFTPKQRSIINTVTNSNAPDTTYSYTNQNAKDPQTEDKIFFLTYKDHTTVYGNDVSSPLRTPASNTDYATIKHGDAYYHETKYFTRSPEAAASVSAFNGYDSKWNQAGIGSNINVGVRPAMWIIL